ncbi:CysC: adenylyl-sulfate kinase (ATP adenosine-5'-phosphosulfate 3'-phosphotransferase) [Desulfosarcina variabilis str. Montpellier]|uniref:adenylyl-sulfate kinase n=1 Tax=Desulfosarcina variabilis TaxID=2300 RepID=UPI003AFA2CEC
MEKKTKTDLVWHHGMVNRIDRERINGHRGFTLWFTGLSAAGKSTLAVATETALFNRGCRTYVLDGDNIRHGLNSDLGFSPEGRTENIRRIAEVANLFRDCGTINLTAFISPYRQDRRLARQLSSDDSFIEIFVDCPVKVCEQRDPKGMYKKARQGMISHFTGISAPYEAPTAPEIHLRTDILSIDDCVRSILAYLEKNRYIFTFEPGRTNDQTQKQVVSGGASA